MFKPRDDLRGGDVPLMQPVQGVLRESVIALLGQMAHERDCLLCSQGLRRSAAPLIHVVQTAHGPIIFMGRCDARGTGENARYRARFLIDATARVPITAGSPDIAVPVPAKTVLRSPRRTACSAPSAEIRHRSDGISPGCAVMTIREICIFRMPRVRAARDQGARRGGRGPRHGSPWRLRGCEGKSRPLRRAASFLTAPSRAGRHSAAGVHALLTDDRRLEGSLREAIASHHGQR